MLDLGMILTQVCLVAIMTSKKSDSADNKRQDRIIYDKAGTTQKRNVLTFHVSPRCDTKHQLCYHTILLITLGRLIL